MHTFFLWKMWRELVGGGGDLAEHLKTVGVHDGDTAKGGALGEGLKEEGSGGLELDLGGLELGELGGVLDLGAAGLLGLLPEDLGHLAGDLGGTGEDDGAVAGLEDTGVLLDDDHGGEGLDGLADTLGLLVDDVTGGDLLVLGDALDGHTDGVTGAGGLEDLLVLLDGEHLLAGEASGGDADDITGLEGTLLDGTGDDLTNTLDVVDIGDGETEGLVGEALRGDDEVVEGIEEGEAGELLLGATVGLPSLVPGGLVGLLDEVVAVEAGVGDEGDLLGLEADHLEHLNELVLDLVETALVPAAGVHLVDTNDDLLDTEEVEETGVLAGLALLNTELGIGLGDGSLETTLLGGDKKKTDIGGGGAGDHVLDVILWYGSTVNIELVIGTGQKKKKFSTSKEKCGTQKSHLVLEIWNRPTQQIPANTEPTIAHVRRRHLVWLVVAMGSAPGQETTSTTGISNRLLCIFANRR